MKKNMMKIAAVAATLAMAFSVAACGSDTTAVSTEAQDETTAETTTVPVETTTASTIPTYSAGPDETNSTPVSWTEDALESEQVMYCYNVDQFLNVRTGPGTDYDIAGHLEPGMAVTVVARTSDGWYKTSDGYYVNESFLSSTAQ